MATFTHGLKIMPDGGVAFSVDVDGHMCNLTPEAAIRFAANMEHAGILCALCSLLGEFLEEEMEFTPERARQFQAGFLRRAMADYLQDYQQENDKGST